MNRPRPTVPEQHGEVLMEPAFREWSSQLSRNQENASQWAFEVAGEAVSHFRKEARDQAIEVAWSYSQALGVEIDRSNPERIVMTGHQPDFYHTGVWIKNFALQRIAREARALAINLVVDSDACDSVAAITPCRTPELGRCTHHLVAGGRGWFGCTAVPEPRELDEFSSAVDASLATLQAETIRENFARFASALREAASRADNVADLMTFARRRLEAAIPTTYLELPVTRLATTPAFAAFAADIAGQSRRFALAYNAELDEYRERTGTRDKTQPFPNLVVEDDRVELPFWILKEDQRLTAWIRPGSDGEVLTGGEEAVTEIDDHFALPPGVVLAPKALTLTLYARMFLSDLFIHGIGGGRYDRVTSGVGHRFYGAVPPEYVVASMTTHLPLGQGPSGEEELLATRERLRRLEFNPDEFVSEAEFEDDSQQRTAIALANEKTALKKAVSEPDADKRAIGSRIGQVNAQLGALLKDHEKRLRSRIEELEATQSALRILNDRSYPFCLWDPGDVAESLSQP